MMFAIFCTDMPNSAEIRASTRPAHLDYIRRNIDHVVLAGPTQTDDARVMNGSLLIMQFDTLAEAQSFADQDPYFQAGLFDSVVIRPWKKVFPEE